MAKWCPVIKRHVVYLDCLECEDRECEKEKKENEKCFEKHVDKH